MANNIDVSAIKVFGKVIDVEGKKTPTGKKCILKFKTTAANNRPSKGELIVGLQFLVESKGGFKPEVQWSTLADPEDDAATATAYFVPLKSGPQKITIKFNGKKISNAPLVIEAVGPEPDVNALLSKVTVAGRGIELGKAYAQNEFIVDASAMQPPLGALTVHVKGPPRSAAALHITDNENGTYKINYKPTTPGQYSMNVKIAGFDIPNSPFNIHVTEHLSAK